MNGLASDCIYETQESPSSGKLLLITNEGFSIFNYKNKTFNNYSAENGFPLTAVNENALCVTCDGEIFLGGIQGMISFHEMELNFTPKPYKIILSRLIVNGREISVGDKTFMPHRRDNPQCRPKHVQYRVCHIQLHTCQQRRYYLQTGRLFQ